jgi:cytochrome oxidase Cu insertion factor (SCO1/SenC/PrrC family)
MGGHFDLAAQASTHRAVLLTFVAADCREECPKIEADLRSAAQRLSKRGMLNRQVEIATVELDPQTNSSRAVRALRYKLWPLPGWAFLRGTPAQTARILHTYGVYVESRKPGKDLVHSSFVYVIDDRLRQVALLAPGVNLTPGKLVDAVDAAVSRRIPRNTTVRS